MLHLVDCRVGSVVTDLKVSIGSTGLVRTLCIGPDGNSVIVGHTSGYISILDLRTGKLRQAWKAHEGEILTVHNLHSGVPASPCNGSTAASSATGLSSSEFISTSLDQTVSVWNSADGKLKASLPGESLVLLFIR